MNSFGLNRLAWSKMGLLLSLYFSQGLPFGFFTQALPVLLRERGYSLTIIGLSSVLALPWALKFLWAPLLERPFGGRWGQIWGLRRSWILPLQALAAIVMIGLSFLGLESLNTSWGLATFAGAIIVANLLASTQDIATDGLAVEILSFEERGLGNGVQVAGYRLGMIGGGGVLLILFSHLQWAGTFWTMALLLGIATLPVILSRERHLKANLSACAADTGTQPHQTLDATTHHLNYWKRLTQLFFQPGTRLWLLVLVTYKFGDAMASAMLRPFLVDWGLQLDEVGVLLGTAGFSAGLLGALVGGWQTGVLGRKRALIIFGVLQALAVLGYAPLALGYGNITSLWVACLIEHYTGGMATAALFTIMMDRCAPDNAGADYTIQASTVVIATGTAAALSGMIADAVGLPSLFVFSAGLSALGLSFVCKIPFDRPSST